MQTLFCFFIKNAISSTPFCPISPRQFPLTHYCIKPNSKKNLADEKIIFNHENTSAVWIN